MLRVEWARAKLESPRIRHFRELLQVRPDDPPERLRENYRRAARRMHPDRNRGRPEAQQAFAEAAEAYRILSRPELVLNENEEFNRSLGEKIRVGGRCFDAGAFFGIRIFRQYLGDRRITRKDRLLGGEGAAPGPDFSAERFPVLESETSILDGYEWDLVELYFGGSMGPLAMKMLREKFSHMSEGGLNELPWYIYNIEGFYAFTGRDFPRAVQLFRDANELVPRNLVVLYRYGLSQEALAADPSRPLSRGERLFLMSRAVTCYEDAIRAGAARTGQPKQKCITIRKQLADAYEAMGCRRKARRVWNEILILRPESAEAGHKRLALSRSKLLTRGSDALKRTILKLLPAPEKETF